MFLKYFLMINLFIFSLVSLFFSDLFMLWLMMEISNFFFISILILSTKNKKMVFFYYLIQALPSFFLVMGFSLMIIYSSSSSALYSIIMICLMIKLGVPPMHLWMIKMSPHLTWLNLFLMLTISKTIPMYLITLISQKSPMLIFMIISCSVIPPIMMFNLSNFKMLFTYSSINQTSWLIFLILLKNTFWLKYFLMYTIVMFMMINIINKLKIFYNSNYLNSNTLMLAIAINLASIPPFTFFLFKWMGIFIMTNNSSLMTPLIILMILSSLLMFYIYMMMMFMSMFYASLNSKIIKMNNYAYTKSYLWEPLMLVSSLTLTYSLMII